MMMTERDIKRIVAAALKQASATIHPMPETALSPQLLPNGKKRMNIPSIVAALVVVVTLALSAFAVWQTSHYAAVQSADTERQVLLSKIDGVADRMNKMEATISGLVQRIDDHIRQGESK
jgi:hypothetical protein